MAKLFIERQEKIVKTYVRIAEDASAAWLYLVAKDDGSKYTMREVVDYLRIEGVSTGVDNDIVIAMVKKGVYNREIQVAKEVPSKPGKDGWYEYFFETEVDRKKPKLNEDGSVDYTSMVAVESVPAGSKLALYHPAKKGRPGMNVRGYDIPLLPVKELPPLKGKGIKIDDNDPNLYISTLEGRIDYKPGTINIDPVFTVRGDVDQLVGKIEFYGDVVVTGNVDSGTSIRAGKNISIDGTVESAMLQAGGDILLKRGIQGNQKGKIICKGTLYADFLEQSTVEAKGNVEANAIMNCDVTSDGKVILTGSHGAIIGGNTHAAKGISCTELGNDVDLTTRVHVGCVNKNYEEQKKLMMKEAATRKDNERIMAELQDIEILIRKSGTLNEDTDKHRKDLYARKKQNDDDLKTLRAELEESQNYIQEINQSTVKVSGTIHRGVRIGIGQTTIMIDKKNSYTEYHLAGGTIEGEVFSV